MVLSNIQRSFCTTVRLKTIQNVTVVGAGIMGSGIAQVSAHNGYKVTMVDENDDILDRAKNTIQNSLSRIGKKKFGDDKNAISEMIHATMNNISSTKDVEEASKNSDLIIEAIIEDRDIKKEMFSRLDKVAPPTAVFASNTSSFLIGSLAEVTKRRDRFVGLHFFNPVPVMKLLELVFPPEVPGNIKEEIIQFGKDLGKVTIISKDVYGFIVNRLMVPHKYDGLMMAERGDATIEDIDIGMKLGCGYPMGLFQLTDFTGLDTLLRVTDGWRKDYPKDTRFPYSKLLSEKVKQGKLGMKTGEGFYKYNKK